MNSANIAKLQEPLNVTLRPLLKVLPLLNIMTPYIIPLLRVQVS